MIGSTGRRLWRSAFKPPSVLCKKIAGRESAQQRKGVRHGSLEGLVSVRLDVRYREAIFLQCRWISEESVRKDLVYGKDIKSPKDLVRMIDHEGVNHGIMKLDNAIEFAKKHKMDLLQLRPAKELVGDGTQADLNRAAAVCKVVDLKKHIYDVQRKFRMKEENQKANRTAPPKEVRFGTNIEENDLRTKSARINDFLAKGTAVRVTISLRKSAQLKHEDRLPRAFEILERVLRETDANGKELRDTRHVEGGLVRLMIGPNSSKP